ncbi:unnamed protein product [Pleuronectes platessa]|uniref:Uncharacterized protein n=1 Tax=Pleuronectes platessa TaxID=8262 RepID=A0A9N7VP35_PLEPL|nr:unnamed protein product [Pleuronectes platessa]
MRRSGNISPSSRVMCAPPSVSTAPSVFSGAGRSTSKGTQKSWKRRRVRGQSDGWQARLEPHVMPSGSWISR